MKYLLAIFLLPLQLFAQDITGVWTGTLYSDSTSFIRYELAISENNGKLSGYSHTIFVVDSIENTGVKSIKVKKEGKNYFIEDEQLIFNNYTAPPPKGIRQISKLALSQNDTAEILSGPWKTNSTREFAAITGNLFLVKRKKPEQSMIIPKLESLALAGKLSFMPAQNMQVGGTLESNATPEAANRDAIAARNPPVVAESREVKVDAPRPQTGVKPFGNSIDSGILAQDTKKQHSLNTGNAYQKPIPVTVISARSSAIQVNKEPKTIDSPLTGTSVSKKDTIAAITSVRIEKPALQLPAAGAIGQSKITNKNSLTAKSTLVNSKEPVIDNNVSEPPLNKPGEPIPEKSLAISVAPVIPSSTPSIDKNTHINSSQKLAPALSVNVNKEGIAINALPVSKPAAEIATRKIEAIRSVSIKSDSLVLTLYDNGEVDGDTVSVLLNGKVIMPMEGLSLKAISKTIYLTPEMGDSVTLIMYAENLGSIPPNTGLLVVHDGDDVYEIRFSGDLQKNSSIILKRKKRTVPQ
jgi:hypothetical protein